MDFKNNLKQILILAIIALAAYLPSFGNEFVWDDEQFIYNNEYVQNANFKKIFTTNTIAGAGETSSYYRPLTTASFAVDYAIWDFKPFGFHLTNTILHTAAGILFLIYLINIGLSKNKSFWVSAIFLSHPLQTEAVVYANSRGDSMYVFYAMLGLLSFSLLLKKNYPKIQIYDLEIKFGKTTLAIFSVVFYLFSVLGKEIGIATLGLFFLTFIIFHYKILLTFKIKKVARIFSKNIHEAIVLLSLLLTAVGYLLFRSKVIHIASNLSGFRDGTPYGDSLYVRLHTFTKAIWIYFGLIIAPYQLHMERDIEILTSPLSIWLALTVILLLVLLTSGLKEYKKRKTVYIWFGSLWYFSMLVPVSGIIPINGLIYEHWLYMPIIGFLITVYGLINLFFKDKLNKYLKYFLPILVGIYILLTIKQNYIWATPVRFYAHTLKFANTARLHNNLAMAYAVEGRYEVAIDSYKKAIEISDFYPQTHYNLGNTYAELQNLEMAKQEYLIALKMNENFFPAYSSLIKIFIFEKDYENAESLASKLQENDPENQELMTLRIQLLYTLKNETKAEKVSEEFLIANNYSKQSLKYIQSLKKELNPTQN